MKLPRVILAGVGARGRTWADVIVRSGSCELAAYVDSDPDAIRRASECFGALPAYASISQALDRVDAVDGVIIATPPSGREDQVRAACERAVPLLIEKPLAMSLQEAARLVAIAEGSGTPMMVGLNFRYLASTQRIRQLCREGSLGTPESARFTYERFRDGREARLNKYPLTMDNPMLWEQSIHHFDLMRYVYDAEPKTVYCRSWNPKWSMYADDANVTAVFEFTNGMTVNYLGTWQGSWSQMRFEWRTDFSEGITIQRDQFGDLAFAHRDDMALTVVELPPHERWFSDAKSLLHHFVEGMVDSEWRECTGQDHLRSLAMVEACIVSKERGLPISVDELLQARAPHFA